MLLVTPQRPPSFLLLPFFGTSLLLQPSLFAHFTCQCATQIAASFIPSKQRAPPPCPSLDLGFFFLSSFHFGLVCWVVCSSFSFPNGIPFSPYFKSRPNCLLRCPFPPPTPEKQSFHFPAHIHGCAFPLSSSIPSSRQSCHPLCCCC